jgi:hypothetical protein
MKFAMAASAMLDLQSEVKIKRQGEAEVGTH